MAALGRDVLLASELFEYDSDLAVLSAMLSAAPYSCSLGSLIGDVDSHFSAT